MKIYLYFVQKICVFYLPKTVSGSYSFDYNEDASAKLINIDARNNQWVLFETEDCKILQGETYVREVTLEPDNFYVITRNHVNYLIYFSTGDDQNVKAFKYENKLHLAYGTQVQAPNITYNCPYVKKLDFQIDLTEDKKLILQVKSGRIYMNKRELKEDNYEIKFGEEIELFGVKIIFLNQLVIVVAKTSIFTFDSNSSGLFLATISDGHDYKEIEVKDFELYEEDDYYSKSPRLRRLLEEKTIDVSAPPIIDKTDDLPILLTVGPMATMGVSSVIMMVSPITQLIAGEVDFSQVGGQLLIGLAMLISTLLWPLLTSSYSKRIRIRKNKENTEKYYVYLQEKEKVLEEELNLEKSIIIENVIPVDACIENIKHRKLNFWDKRIDQNDFLVARIGVGDEELKAEINFNEDDFSVDDNELKQKAKELVGKYKYIPDVPIGYSFYENNITAIMGDYRKCHYFVNNILIQLLSFYSYDDFKVVVFTNEKNQDYWDYIKYLNHNMTNDSSFRFFASNEDNASIVIDVLKQEINNRISQMTEGNENRRILYKPYYLIIVDDLSVLKKSNLLESLTEIKNNIGFSAIILERSLSKLPSLCSNFITLGENSSGVLKNSYEKQEQKTFKDEVQYQIDMMEIARSLANVPVETSGNDVMGELPESITFLEMAKVGKVEQLNIMSRWDTNDSTANLKTEVGVGVDGKLMYLDLHEKAHGPHGLIAGMTGSGKSEFIITWILSLCMNFSPEDVAFILIDYKGGGLAFAFENKATGVRLPHLTGTITNLDKAEINRTLVSIDSEVKRRQKIFNEARDKLGESTMDIYKYQGYFHDGKLEEPLPHLFIVCDEFAELKAQQPDFMDNLISVARIGRSLGVHLILATQKPSGVVNDQIWSNTKFRVCLKVQDASDSNEMLKKPDAASLKQTGRFYLQVGYDEYYALGQSGWCGAKYYPSEMIQKSIDKSINIIDETGVVLKTVQASGNTVQKGEAQGEQLAAILNEIIKVATQSNRFAKRLWLDNIPEDITYDEIKAKYKIQFQKDFNMLMGEYDAPESQSQYPLYYNLLDDGSGNIIGNDSQEYESVVTMVLYNIMLNYRPDEISYYIVDYGSQNFMKFEKDPHCGGVVTPADNEKYQNLLKLIMEEQRNRKKKLSSFGGEYREYVKKYPGDMPLLFVVFNNYESIDESNEDLYERLGEFLRDSDRYGIVYLFTSSTPSAVPDRFKQLMPFTLALKLKDPGDYGYLFPSKGKKEPKDVFGRGVCAQETVHEFQTASICKDKTQEMGVLTKIFDALKNQENYPFAKPIPSLPEQILLKDVAHKLKGFKKVPVGIEKGTLEVLCYNFTIDVAKTILTNKMKNLKSYLKSFLEEIMTLKQYLIVLDVSRLLPDLKDKVSNYFLDDYDNKMDKITEFIENNTSGDKEVLLVVIGLTKLLEKIEDPSKWEALMDTFKQNEKSHILIVDEALKFKELSYEDWYKKVDVSEGVYVGPGVEEQGVYNIASYSKELSQLLPKNYGYYIADGYYHTIKLLEFERIEADDNDEE